MGRCNVQMRVTIAILPGWKTISSSCSHATLSWRKCRPTCSSDNPRCLLTTKSASYWNMKVNWNTNPWWKPFAFWVVDSSMSFRVADLQPRPRSTMLISLRMPSSHLLQAVFQKVLVPFKPLLRILVKLILTVTSSKQWWPAKIKMPSSFRTSKENSKTFFKEFLACVKPWPRMSKRGPSC